MCVCEWALLTSPAWNPYLLLNFYMNVCEQEKRTWFHYASFQMGDYDSVLFKIERGVFIRMACPLRFRKESWPPVLIFAFLSLRIGRTIKLRRCNPIDKEIGAIEGPKSQVIYGCWSPVDVKFDSITGKKRGNWVPWWSGLCSDGAEIFRRETVWFNCLIVFSQWSQRLYEKSRLSTLTFTCLTCLTLCVCTCTACGGRERKGKGRTNRAFTSDHRVVDEG